MRNPKQPSDIADLRDELRRTAALLAALTNADGDDEQGSFTIKQFLKRHQLSESTYHALRRLGKGPRTMRTGSAGRRISRAAERDWILEREREAAEVGANAHGMALRAIPRPEKEPGAPSRELPVDSRNRPLAAGSDDVQSKCLLSRITP